MLPRILVEARNSVFLIEHESVQAYLPIVAAAFKGEAVAYDQDSEKQDAKFNITCFAAAGYVKKVPTWEIRWNEFQDVPENTTIVIPIKDVISKYNYCGSPGTTTLSEFVKSAEANKNIVRMVFDIDSPGGEADGTLLFAELIKSIKTETVAFCSGRACSAAYWIAAACDKILFADEMTRLGSIGTYRTFFDDAGWYEQNGVKTEDIYATHSTLKNHDWREAKKGNFNPMKAEVDKVNVLFMTTMEDYREIEDEDALKGKVYFGSESIAAGLADAKGTLQDAIAMTVTEVEDANVLEDEVLESKNENMKQFENVNKTLGVDKLESADDKGVYLNEDQLQALDLCIGTGNQASVELATEKTARENAEGELATANTTIQEKEGEITTLTEKLAEKPGTEDPKVEGKKDDIETEEEFVSDPVTEYAKSI
ncbi:hypothetical protein DF185_19870 [Marinifilum breve]|uniref:Peptidase S49 domain-containing protein n=1 Tax=Marinifilum breve TaxID=2184082 RepID=A0A2V4A689_9BACT|nr:S49 family peptidase [Marinifilum breve]PXX96900.1 hypothetical protein DF185_19870 [Marinifilum breve]